MRTRRSPKNQDRLWRELGKEKAPMIPCEWKEDDEGTWFTSCDNAFVFTDSGPTENGMKFCCYCGKPLKEVPYEEGK
jgi:hypothetical protein